MEPIPYYHVDVFSLKPFSGNGLTVFTETAGFSTAGMQLLTQEMRQFESIFLRRNKDGSIRARIFTCSEELDFAGHPVLGAAATLHDLSVKDQRTKIAQAGGMAGHSQTVELDIEGRDNNRMEWLFELNEKSVDVTTEKKADGYEATMNQGAAEFGRVLNEEETASILEFLHTSPEELYPGLYPTVVSTGLPYLIVPFLNNRFQAKIGAQGLEERLHTFGARFIGLLDIETRSIRTGNNDGSLEDIATGSLAGPAGAFLVNHSLAAANEIIVLNQGKNLSRDSRLFVEIRSRGGGGSAPMDVFVSGGVCKIGKGVLEPGLIRHLIAY